MDYKNSIKALPVSIFNTATLDPVAWQAINAPAGILEPCFILRFTNSMANPVEISFDGVGAHIIMRAATDVTFNFDTNPLARIAKGSIVYVRGVAAAGTFTMGGFFLSPNP